jgi:phenylacetate-CoA ligase
MNIKSLVIWALRRGQTKAFVRQVSDATSRLEKFNTIWKDAYVNVPFYKEWKEKYSLPDEILSLSELKEWPILEKKDLILNKDKLVRLDIKKFHESVTGGATGEPLQFRTMPGESDAVTMNKWIGWARMGIYPDSRCFLLWGHRHFYGQGFKSNLKFAWRQFKDWMTNNLRVDATDLSLAALKKDVIKLIRFKPECIIAYSASLLALVRTCKEYQQKCQSLKIKGIICTAGPLTKDERDEIGSFFNAPVGMEYGSMEGGVMAYQTPKTRGRYKVFDSTHLIHIGKQGEDSLGQIFVTSLTRRYLPLIRYRIGDYASDSYIREDGTVESFSEVTGRVGDMIDLGNGVRFHGYSIMVCAEENSKIIAYQLKVNKKIGTITFLAQVLMPLSSSEILQIQKHAADVASISPECITVEEVTELIKAPSGKIRLVIEES